MFAVLSLLLLSPAFQLSASAAPPPIQRPMGFIEERAEGDNPWTVDYSAAYDTASCELIQNMMDTLIVFNGEHADQYLPSIATNWTNTSLGSGIDSGLPVAGGSPSKTHSISLVPTPPTITGTISRSGLALRSSLRTTIR